MTAGEAYEPFVVWTVLVVGGGTSLAGALPPGTSVVYADPKDELRPLPLLSLVVLDARTHSLEALSTIRESPQAKGVPALLFASATVNSEAMGLRVDHVVVPGAGRRDVARCIQTLLELGRARVALALAEGALSHAQSLSPPGSVSDGFAARWEPDRAAAVVRASAMHSPPPSRRTLGAIVELERVRSTLSEQQLFHRAILDGVDVGIATTDSAGRVTFLNRTARDLLRRDDDATGLFVSDVLGLASTPENLLGAESRRTLTHVMRLPSGAEAEIELSVTLAEEATRREHIGFFFIFRDITVQKKLDLDRARFERLAAMGTLVAGFAHEVRNPIASLRSLAESLQEELAELDLRLPHLGRMLRVLGRVERLVHTSVLFGTPEPPRRAFHRPWSIMLAATSGVAARVHELGGEIRVEVEAELPDVFVDDGQAAQVLVNLLNNALDVTNSPRDVLLRAVATPSPDGDRTNRRSQPAPVASCVKFEVTNAGPGIAPPIVSRIFDPYFTTKASGTGLGLSIAQQLVSENGGRIEVTSPPSGPTTFAVVLVAGSAADP